MDSEPPQGGSVLRHYTIEPSGPPPHQHSYEYVGGKRMIRYCECGKSWALVELRNIIDNSSFFLWKETKEESDL